MDTLTFKPEETQAFFIFKVTFGQNSKYHISTFFLIERKMTAPLTIRFNSVSFDYVQEELETRK